LELVYADMPPQLQLQRQRLDLAVTV
jgi:hypothetical protein